MMSMEPVLEQRVEEKQVPQCGRLVFRGVELAYLNIDGEYMLPLAELLALVLPSTPRTTLFTRMEKMKVRRHFCEPEEIKLLKTVNGIHGSSANCTLLSKTEVEKYCSTYIDKPSEFNQEISRDANAEQAASEVTSMKSALNDKEKTASNHLNSNTTPNKLAVLCKHKNSAQLKPKLRLTKVATAKKLKSRFPPDCEVNKTLTDNAKRAAIDGDLTSGSVNRYEEGCLLDSPSSSHHVTNFTQTKSLANLGANKKRVKKRDSRSGPKEKMRKVVRGKKRTSHHLDIKEPFEAPLKIPKRSELNGLEESDKKKEVSQFPTNGCNPNKQDFDSLISDSSSNDSGFGSTALSNASTPTKTDFSAGELSGSLRMDEDTIKEHAHTSPCTLKLKTPKKDKTKEIRNRGKSLTLSPPALLLKRFEDSWLVEQKSPVNKATNCLHKRKVKPREKARPAVLTPLFEGVCGPKPLFQQKQVKKAKKCRKPLSLKEEIERKPLVTKDLILGDGQDGTGIIKKKKFKRRKRKGKLPKLKARNEQTLFNGRTVSPEKIKLTDVSKSVILGCLPQRGSSPKTQLDVDKQTKEELLKKDSVLERLVGTALTKFFGTATSDSTRSTEIKVIKPKPKKPKAKPASKANCNFKLLNLFPATSLLTLAGGGLCPSFTMACPKGIQPHSSHPVWQWSLGRPVVQSCQKSLKPKPVQKELLSKAKLITNKVRKLKRRRKKLSTNKKPLVPVSDPNVAKATVTESKLESAPIATSEFKLPLSVAASNIVLS